MSSVTPSLARLAATDATGPCRRPIACSARPRLTSSASRSRVTASSAPSERGDGVEPSSEGDARRPDVAALVGERGHRHVPSAVQGAEERVPRAGGPRRGTPRRTRCRRSSGAAGARRCRARPCRRGRTRCPAWRGASGSVRARRIPRSATRPLEHHTFWPVTTQSSPSSSARVLRPARSLPAPGSEKSWHQTCSASRIAAQVGRLLLRRAEGEDRAAREHDPDHVDPRWDLGDGALRGPRRGVLDGEPAAAVLHRPVQPCPPGREQRSLPGPALFGQVRGQDGAVVTGRLGLVGGQPGTGVVTELVHLHGDDGMWPTISGMMVPTRAQDEEC